MTGRNPWAVLRVAEDAPYHEVQRAFRRRVKQTHPDHGGNAAEFATVVAAFEAVLRPTPAPRRPVPPRPTPYDSWLRPTPATTSSTSASAGSWDDAGGRGRDMTRAEDLWLSPAADGEFTAVLRHEMARVAAA